MNTVSPKMIEAGKSEGRDKWGIVPAEEWLPDVYTAMLNARDPYEEGDVERVADAIFQSVPDDLDEYISFKTSLACARAAITALIQSEGGVK